MIELRLPLPTSANAIWARTRTGMRKSDSYKAWITEAGWEARRQRPGKIQGKYKISIHAVRPDNKRRDLSNLLKATEDLLQSLQIIENDCLAEMILMRWVTSGSGITVILEPAAPDAIVNCGWPACEGKGPNSVAYGIGAKLSDCVCRREGHR